jgi:GAF domain-containing protein
MEIAKIPSDEAERLRALTEYSILDSLAEQEYEEITLIASAICQTPIALITLIDSDRQWFKSHVGLEMKETPRDHAFCTHAINSRDSVFIVKDARNDKRFDDNPLVTGHPNIVFYASVPLVNPEGIALGTICVIDNRPRELTQKQLDSLAALSNQVIRLFESRKAVKKTSVTV